jgi:hypothetical protein
MLLRQLLERQTSLCVCGNNPAAPFSWHSWCTFRSDFLSNVPDINLFDSFTFFFTAILCLRKPVRGLGARRLLVTAHTRGTRMYKRSVLVVGHGVQKDVAMLWCPWNSTDGSIGDSTRGDNTGSKHKSAAIGFSWSPSLKDKNWKPCSWVYWHNMNDQLDHCARLRKRRPTEFKTNSIVAERLLFSQKILSHGIFETK